MRAILRVGCVTVCLLTLAGCANGLTPLDDGARSGMDMQEAADRADEILGSTIQAIDPEVYWTHGPSTSSSCDVTRRRVIMTVISADRRGSFLGVVDRFWRRSGYRIISVRGDVEVPAIYARTGDGFGISLTVGGDGQVFFEADTPCVQESEVADPTAKPNTPSYEGMENIPRPNIHSDFWSAVTPASPSP